MKPTAASSLAAGLLLLLHLPHVAIAGPSVNVALQASFDAGPYLVELLETAAEENSTAYFPLLDRIAEGAFESATTEQDLYRQFLRVLHDDGHLADAESLDSFKLALSIRSAAPRIQAHYQYYNSSVQSTLAAAQDAACPVWVHMDGKQYCSPTLERAQQPVEGDSDPRELPFDRTFGDPLATPAVLYADVSSPIFGEYHRTLKALAKDGEVAYRVRYRSIQNHDTPARPLFMNGYGVELTLKRTDYIVIDDRQDEERGTAQTKAKAPSTENLEDESSAELTPLSSSEVLTLGTSAAGFVVDSQDPFTTLVKLSQDFPKHSAAVAAYNTSDKFLEEYMKNRQAGLPGARNIMWINGQQIDTRQVDSYSLLEHLRRERRLIGEFKKLGLAGSEAVDLLSHSALAEVKLGSGVQRYDWRDEAEEGGVLIWMNDIEKDSRYASFSANLQMLLQPMYPGQLPPVRRDIHNVVVPVDLANEEDVGFIVQYLYVFVKRMLPVRFGLVPIVHTEESKAQAKIAHHLQQTYGLASLLKYLEETASSGKNPKANKKFFAAAIADRALRPDRQSLSFDEVLQSQDLEATVTKTAKYLRRLDLRGPSPPTLVNGVAMSRTETYLQSLPMQLGNDVQVIQQALIQGEFEKDSWIAGFFLLDAAQSRNEWIVPENDNEIRMLNMLEIASAHNDFNEVLRLPSDKTHTTNNVQLVVVGDFNTDYGLALLVSALKFRQSHLQAEVIPLHTSDAKEDAAGVSSKLYELLRQAKQPEVADVLLHVQSANAAATHSQEEQEYWTRAQKLVESFGFALGASGVVVNGRVVGPLPSSVEFGEAELEHLYSYELSRRLGPVTEALGDLGIESKVTGPLAFAKLTSLLALSNTPDVPEGIFESKPKYRLDVWGRWNSTYSGITAESQEDASINIVATIDPTSELSQRWVPILKTLSELAGVKVKIFLTPVTQLQELPIKRFYRHVLSPEPLFDENGALIRPEASFRGLPQEALFTLSMDVAPSWLVAPKESVHDLDNIKLGALKDGTDVDAIYQLEHILIEGHSTDTTLQTPPRGVQLLLESEGGSFFADTIVMDNLGYFQFKAQPGFWKIELKEGRSQSIFKLDSVGAKGRTVRAEDDGSNEVALLSFQGKTLFPRLSRKPGKEDEDVLETGPRPGSAMDYVSKGLNFAQGMLGVKSSSSSKSVTAEKHAEINIFSVASGHLYERMLNIMMVSVMKNTQHTVKFWFIEQFLSPSFKSFLPHLAAEYGFSYEMVTYKWPHWLRGQREKQREIWGYKILFLDVLFPLSLDKVIFVDADQIVRTDMYDLVSLDLEGAPYGFTPMCDSRTEMEGFRFWKQGYWKTYLKELPYHISALYVVDLQRFREVAAGDRLRGQYHTLSADPQSLSNLDQDLPNHLQTMIPIKSLPQDWLWCETWCSDESLASARTIDLCNNPMTKEPKLDRARRQVPEWTVYDDEIAALAKRVAQGDVDGVDDVDVDVDAEDDVDHVRVEEQLRKDEL
ncbi:UDP-glucose:glycoprotein glucosyltransferase [Talaromyces islandicus]|uniref:UDP-glucose:glycoprotein glucosyltransferase n=1 Tax=Talaromyces islandicus TaxID=28573 RepID=A0A0U1LQN7_TALIS|nr:UDP-glucose:glycoprotein glucosyltransferase [Talaromyces islandicus]